MALPKELTNKKAYLIKPPSQEAISSRELRGDPFVLSITREDFKRLQRERKAELFFERLGQAGIVKDTQFHPRYHNGFYRPYWYDESPLINMLVYHKDRKILAELMEEFVDRGYLKELAWSKLKHLYVN